MLLLNFSHPLSTEQLAQIEGLLSEKIERVIEVHSQVDPQQPLGPQIVQMVNSAGLSPAEWQNQPLLVNPPALNYSAVLLLAELHGRMGYFPTCLRLRPVKDALPPRYELAELMNLQAMRDAARSRRHPTP